MILVELALFTLLAASVQGAAGFGFGLVATTGFVWVLGSSSAVPLVIVLSLATSSGLAIQLRTDVDWRVVRGLLAGAFIGLPFGLAVFRALDADALMIVVSVAVLASVALLAARGRGEEDDRAEPTEPRTTTSALVGAVAGVLTTSIGMPGPPVVLYLAGIGAAKDEFRATTLTFFVGAYLAALILLVGFGGVESFVWGAAGVLLPIALSGAWIGHRLSRLLREEVFRWVALGLIAVIGLAVLATVLLS